LFICLQLTEPVIGTRGSSGAAISQMVGAGAQVTRDGPGVISDREAGARAVGTRGRPEAAGSAGAGVAGTRGNPGAAPIREAGAIVLN
jgi:hypothetical protein